MKAAQITCWFMVAAFCTGCGTITNRDSYDTKPYGGVAWDFEMVTGNTGSCMGFPIPCMILDVPFSLVGDTLFLPFDIHYARQAKEYEAALQANPDPLKGWVFTPAVIGNAEIEKDYKSYYQQLPKEQKNRLTDITSFKNSSGEQAVEIEIGFWGSVVLWRHILFYDQNNMRVRVVRYERGRLSP
jgi:uncharacterized protein YceK